jgi:hypothetical protein
VTIGRGNDGLVSGEFEDRILKESMLCSYRDHDTRSGAHRNHFIWCFM